MSREDRQRELGEKARALLRASLKHVRAAALVAALVPLASVLVSRAVAQTGGCDPESGIPCPTVPSVPVPCDFITGGGFVFTDSGARANFGSHGGCKNGAFWGHVNYVDHEGFLGATPYHVDSIEITAYGLVDPLVPDSTARDICGRARTNADEPQPVFFRVRMDDEGEPGVLDMFGIRLSNGYYVPTRLLGDGGPGGGNVQLHKDNPSSSTPPSTPPDCGGLDTP